MIARATTDFTLVGAPSAKECELVAQANVGAHTRGYLLDAATGRFQSDRAAAPPLTDAELRALADISGQQVTYTCVAPGEGVRLGLDRDGDGHFDGDEIDAGTDPADRNDPRLCVGDCSADHSVTIDEILLGVAIALGIERLDECLSFDPRANYEVSVSELIQAVNAALHGCDAVQFVCPLQPAARCNTA